MSVKHTLLGGPIYLSAADYVIQVFGGVRATARAIGRAPTTVSKWHNRKYKNCGKIPTSAMQLILTIAENRGLDITADDLIRGREVRED